MRLDRKAFGRVATTFVATAMLAAFAAVPAMAEGEQVQLPVGDASNITQITIDKVLEKPANALAPNYTFNFSITPAGDANVAEGALLVGESATGEKSDKTPVTLDVYKGVSAAVSASAVGDGKAVFAPDADKDIGKTSLTESVTFSINAGAFTHAGVYKYTVTEQSSNYDGITNDTSTTRDLYVYVENNATSFQVVGAVVKGADDDKTDRFTNTYLTDDTGDDTNELYIEKNVEGALGNKSEEFAFTIAISSNVGVAGAAGAEEQYYAVVETPAASNPNADPDGVWDPVTSGAPATPITYTLTSGPDATPFTLKDNQRLHIYGLSANDAYTIKETLGNKNGYVTSVSTGTGYTAANDDVKTVTGNVDPDGSIQNIVYTNFRDSVTPTGVLLNVAPYALMVIIAAAGCFVFLRKRRDD